MKLICADCRHEFTGPDDPDLVPLEECLDLDKRLDPGSEVPYGEHRDCGALVHDEQHDDPEFVPRTTSVMHDCPLHENDEAHDQPKGAVQARIVGLHQQIVHLWRFSMMDSSEQRTNILNAHVALLETQTSQLKDSINHDPQPQ